MYSSASPSLLKPLHVSRSSQQTAAISSAALKAVSSHQGEYQTPQAGCTRSTSVNTSLLALSRYTLFSSLFLLTRLASAASPAFLKCQMWRSSSASSPGTVFVSTPAAVWKKQVLGDSLRVCRNGRRRRKTPVWMNCSSSDFATPGLSALLGS